MDRTQDEINDGLKLPLVEDFYTLQGEGFHAGKAAYFIRLGGCDVGCSWCDSRFSWDPALHPLVNTDDIIRKASDSGTDSVVVTGGEPLMWNLDYLCDGLKKMKIKTFLETSGSHPVSGKWDWICLSPKINKLPSDEIYKMADELKVIILGKHDFVWAERYRGVVSENCMLYLQPEWSRFEKVVPEVIEYIKSNPAWRISVQIHKYLHIP